MFAKLVVLKNKNDIILLKKKRKKKIGLYMFSKLLSRKGTLT